MKVVLIEKPKFISAILRKIYGIKKGNQAGIIVICLDTVPKSCYWL